MNPTDLRIALVFSSDDQGWIRRSSIEVPKFWQGHGVAPALGDIVRVGGRQFCIEARVWEHDGSTPVLRLFVGSGRAQSDTSFGFEN
jgi:hypothetical protein